MIKKKLVIGLAMVLVASNCLYASAAPLSEAGDAIVVSEELQEDFCEEDCIHDCGDNHCREDGCGDDCGHDCFEEECYGDDVNREDETFEEDDLEESSETNSGEEADENEEEENNQPEDVDGENEELSDTYKNFTYTSNGTYITITKYNGSESSVTVPSTIANLPVQEIGQEAFNGNLSITSVTIPSSVKKIGTGAFCNCQKMATLTLNEGLTEIGNQSFKYCFALKSVTIPSTVSKVGTSAFEQCKNMTSVTMKGSYIAPQMFYDCVALSSISIPSSVTYFGNGAFMNCISLTSATIEANAAIGNNAFDSCSSLSTVTLKNVTKIGNSAFARSGVKSVTIPASATYIDGKAFYNCEKLTSVTISEGVNTLRSQAFQNCTALKEVTLPSTLTSVYSEVFRGCTSLTTVNLGGGSVGMQMFQDCTSLAQITIPSTVYWIGDYAFKGCTSLSKATIESSGSIEAYAFDGCSKLTNVSLKNSSVTAIKDAAFRQTGVSEIVLPDSVNSVGGSAFYGCSSLKSAEFMGNVPGTFGSSVFDGANSSFVIKYHEGKTGWTTPKWNNYNTTMIPESEHVHHLVHTQAKAANCTTAGNSEYWYCDTCNKYYSDANATKEIAKDSYVIAKLGHDYKTVSGTAKEATCTEAGKKADQKCSRCQKVVTGDTIAKLGHNYQDVSGTAKAATCTTAGKKADQKCSRCQNVVTGDTIAKLGHNYQDVSGTAKAATCTTAGKKADQKCSRCQNVVTGETIAKLGHNYQDVSGTAKAATCTADGKKADRKCSRCQKVVTGETIAKLGHNYQDVSGTAIAATCTKAGKKADQKCSRCKNVIEGAAIAKLGHNWDNGVVTKAPTTSAEGVKTYTCQRCKKTRTESIPKLEKTASEVFSDVPANAWYADAVQFVYSRGIMSGKSATTFDPNKAIHREEFVQTLYSMSGKPAVAANASNPFSDVKGSSGYPRDAILWAYQKGYVSGNKNGTFGVGNNLQREALVSILYKYASANGYNMSYDSKAINGYSDTSKVNSWSKNAFCWAVSKGIISGKGDKGVTDKSKMRLDPQGNASRAECAAMLMRLIEMKQ